MFRFALSLSVIGAIAPLTNAGGFLLSAATSWEDPTAEAILGSTGNVGGYGYHDQDAYGGSSSLFILESPVAGTPEAYVAYVTGLQPGDAVYASMWFKGEGVVGKGRLWGHYANADIDAEDGSAGGAISYAGIGNEWEKSSYTWTVPEGKTGLVIEARTYSYGQDDLLLADDLFVGVNSTTASIQIAGQSSAPVVPGPAAAGMALGGLVAVRRRRR